VRDESCRRPSRRKIDYTIRSPFLKISERSGALDQVTRSCLDRNDRCRDSALVKKDPLTPRSL